MRIKSVALLVVAVGLGGTSVVMLKGWLNSQLAAQPAAAARATVPVVVARTPLPFGSRLHSENLTLVTWPAESVPTGTFSKIEDLLGKNEDRVVLRYIEPAEPILATKISGPGGRATLSTVVTKDQRAVTIRVNDVLGVAGFVLPGDRVDVLLTRKDDQHTDPATDVLLQNIRVLGIDQDSSDRKDKPTVARAVTLEVSPDEAQKLTLGTQVGVLSLALRNQADGDLETVRTIGITDLRPGRPTPVAVRAAPRHGTGDSGIQIGIIRGTETSSTAVRRE